MRVGACLLIAVCGAAGPSTTLAHFPNTVINAIKVDNSGNIYVAGYQGTIGTSASWDAFIAKLSPNGSTILYSATFAGSMSDIAVALDIDSAGAAYILGDTDSPDFPVTPGAFQTAFLAPDLQGFVAKVDAQEKVVYATLIGGSSDFYPSSGGILADAAGEAVVSGRSAVLKLDATGGELLADVGAAGGRLASDGEGNIYVAGLQYAGATVGLPTPGAFQSTFQPNVCGGTSQIGTGCFYQYVTKMNASLTQVVYSTYVTGRFGAAPAAIWVDAQGNVLLAGTTNSPDYPTTSDAFEPFYVADAPSPLQTEPGLFREIYPPPASGYFTILNATGTGLVYSTYFSGTQADAIAFAAFTSGGGIYLSGQAGSSDLPGLVDFASQCLPQTFATSLSSDGLEVGAVRILSGNVPAYDPVTATLLAWTGADLISFNPAAPPDAISCIVDSADLRTASAVAPGELLTIFGPYFVDEGANQAPGSFATSLAGVTVTLNGIASPLLYVSAQQINFQAPYEIANNAQVSLALASSQTDIADSRTLPVSGAIPVAFLDTVTLPASLNSENCPFNAAFQESGGILPLAFNSDGSRNTCSNPASAGSVVTIFLAGLGVTIPAPVTGATNSSPGVPLNLPITLSNGLAGAVVSAVAAPGSISGIWHGRDPRTCERASTPAPIRRFCRSAAALPPRIAS